MATDPSSPVILAPDYYLTNFRSLVDFVQAHYAELLSQDEREFYRHFCALSTDAQKLYIRMLSRKGEWFRRCKLHYEEINAIEEAALELQASGLLRINPDTDLQQLLPLFTKAELIKRSRQMALKSLRRELLELALLECDEPQRLLSQLTDGEQIYHLQCGDCFNTFKLCFFGNLRQDMTDYVLRDLGLTRYENYPLDHQNLPFQSREQIERHLQYYACLDRLDEVVKQDREALLTLHSQLPDVLTDDTTLARRIDRINLTLARQLERLQAFDAAVAIYSDCRQPPARERRARIAVGSGDIDTGLSLCQQILETPINEEEAVFAAEFGYRSAKKHGREWPVPTKYRPPTETVDLTPGEEPVEQLAAKHLAQAGACFYVENTLFNGVLGLYIWDVIFAPIRGAFFNPFQSSPSDFYSMDFYSQRASLLKPFIDTINEERLASIVFKQFANKQGIANPLVNWSMIDEPLLTLALQRIPIEHWRAIFMRLLNDLRHHRSGLPDLIVFPDCGGYELVEVKGPGDSVQKNQLRWMRFFANLEIPHRVLHVQWTQ